MWCMVHGRYRQVRGDDSGESAKGRTFIRLLGDPGAPASDELAL